MVDRKASSRRDFMRRVGAGLAAAGAPLVLPSRLCHGGVAAPSNRLNVALIGCGSRNTTNMEELFRQGANVVALCDVDSTRIASARKAASASVPDMPRFLESARGYEDYRHLLDREKSIDGAVIAVGPWWHGPMSTAFMQAGKHVYCEKPLTRLVSEARALGDLARRSRVATQLGTQGAAGEHFRRGVEVVQSGLLGFIREVHIWNVAHPRRPASHDRPPGADPIPAGFNWDLWVGPSPERPFKKDTYLPGCMTTFVWFDFGAGLVTEFGTHTWQLPIRALKLGFPVHVEHNVPEPVRETYASNARIRYDFPARGDLPAVTAWYYDTVNRPPAEAVAELEPTYPKLPVVGALLMGDKGTMYVGGWGGGNLIKLKGEVKMRSVVDHPATQSIPMTEPRQPQQNHMLEWIEAAKGGPKPYQSFEVGAHSMEVILPGIVSLRMQRPIDWDGANMKVPGTPEADRFIHADYRKSVLI